MQGEALGFSAAICEKHLSEGKETDDESDDEFDEDDEKD